MSVKKVLGKLTHIANNLTSIDIKQTIHGWRNLTSLILPMKGKKE